MATAKALTNWEGEKETYPNGADCHIVVANGNIKYSPVYTVAKEYGISLVNNGNMTHLKTTQCYRILRKKDLNHTLDFRKNNNPEATNKLGKWIKRKGKSQSFKIDGSHEVVYHVFDIP